ncbi:GHKL domain-containing protein [Lysinibacillus yapensis]|uniref:GHKL domain-containing protein n=1 Tax=Ureibacillus yapensis TaxID=2304605 RepID=A0A396S6E7_9BACL|nr:GHKL domain-containing protein [Lysinibacillus yapensis]RHW35862.1 GHKL domain-containing protein [Lysinibacillus yapensis]
MKSYRVKMILILSICLLIFFTVLSFYVTNQNMNTAVEESIANQSLESAKRIAETLDVDTYKKFLMNPEKNEYYWAINDELNHFRVDLGALFVYTIKIDNPTVSQTMIAGLPRDKQDFFEIGKPTTIPPEQVVIGYRGMPFTTGVIDDPRYGTYLTVGTPIFDQEDQIIGYLAIDISTSKINAVKEKVQENNLLIFLMNALFTLIIIISFHLLQRWYQKEVAKELASTEDTYQGEIRTLISSVSSLRHDYLNHIQVIQGLLAIGNIDKAKEYIDSLSNEVLLIESINPEIEHPGLAILLKSKKVAAQNQQIQMKTDVANDSFHHITSTDLIKILSNLIDNAMEATMELPESQRNVSILCDKMEDCYLFEVKNTGYKIVDDKEIFKQGFTTKPEHESKVRGQGLFIVKEVVNKYYGDIEIHSKEDGFTIATVKIPTK